MSESDLQRLSGLVLDEFKRVHDRLDSFDTQFSDLRDEVQSIRKQLDQLEKASTNFGGFTNEIDHLLGRVAAIEKHLGLQNNIRA